MALNVDICKAYDRISWKYLEAIMRRMGFDPHSVDMIMLCISTVQYHVIVNPTPMEGLEHIRVWGPFYPQLP